MTTPQDEKIKIVDAIWVDDDERMTNHASLNFADEDKVVIYRTPKELMQNIHRYPKKTCIFLDNNFEGFQEKGIDIAAQLHQLGFTTLYLISGDLELGVIPDYFNGTSQIGSKPS